MPHTTPLENYPLTQALYTYTKSSIHTLKGCIGSVVASDDEGSRVDSRQRLHRFILCTRRSGALPMRVGCAGQSIESTVSDAIVRIWLWSTATRSCPLGYFSNVNLPCNQCNRFSPGGFLSIEGFSVQHTFQHSPPSPAHSFSIVNTTSSCAAFNHFPPISYNSVTSAPMQSPLVPHQPH